jgi:hypothetical protein
MLWLVTLPIRYTKLSLVICAAAFLWAAKANASEFFASEPKQQVALD